MANVDKPFGLRPQGNLSATGAQKQYAYLVAEDYDADIFQGDLVTLVDGYVVKVDPEATDAALGVFNGCFYNDPTTGKPTFSNKFLSGVPYTADVQVDVIDDPNQLFSVQANGEVVQANIGKNATVDFGTGNTTTGASDLTLDAASIEVDAGLHLKIVGLLNTPDNSLGENAVLVVKINNHLYGSAGVAGIAA
jgi:hypothetical protein